MSIGSHCDVTHIDRGALEWAIKTWQPVTFLDIGCGPGGMLDLAAELGLSPLGIDGDRTVKAGHTILYHDFTTGKLEDFGGNADLGWSVEFVEHVPEEFVPNFMEIFATCKNVIMTHALPGAPGIGHVNCQESAYWVEKFEQYGLKYDPLLTRVMKEASTMRREFIQSTGMVFTR